MKNLNDQGQTLVLVLFATTLALVVAAGLSLNSVTSLNRISTSDTSARTLASAEGGAEAFLIKSKTDLAGLINTCDGSYDFDSAPNACRIDFPSIDNKDSLNSRAVVEVDALGNGPEYDVLLQNGKTVQVSMNKYAGTKFNVCWSALSPIASSDSTALSFNMYDFNLNELETYVLDCASCTYPNGMIVSNPTFTATNGTAHNMQNCVEADYPFSSGHDVVFRLRSLGGDSAVKIVAETGVNLPLQGYEIISSGMLVNSNNNYVSDTVRTVRVRKSLPYVAGFLDYALYSDSGTID
ncbi:MAG: hypothetical protein R3B92_00780 [Patescibacteria group bacterium]|uniref:Uncharacterized protein n=1 Tax=candidate division WWE3 bacterium TaxID=2053526 RepID=A0A955ED60_UNCKA|nr:hypothetical protein [candidate division WWE3 bacterium]